MKRIWASFFLLFAFFFSSKAQPYLDLISVNTQYMGTTYNDSSKSRNNTQSYFIQAFIPIKLDSQNTFLTRFYGEQLSSTISNAAYSNSTNLYCLFIGLGLQHESKNKKWKYLGMVVPRIASDLKEKISSYDEQMGGYVVLIYNKSTTLKLKAGIYYNKDLFGNFFLPLIGLDWKINDRFSTYGLMPNFYRFEYAIAKQKIYTGLGYKGFTRSYRLNSTLDHNYVKNQEVQLKLFVDVYLKKKFILFAEFGRTLGYSPLAYMSGSSTPYTLEPVYTSMQDNFFVNFGLAYRLRFDFN